MAQIERRLPYVKAWIRGESVPSFSQLKDFALITNVPVGVFFLSEPPIESLPIPYFRTRTGQPPNPSANLIDTVYAMLRRVNWMEEFLREQGADRLAFVGSGRSTDPIDRLAERMRGVLGLSKRWAREVPTWSDALRYLRQRMEHAGILVVVNSVVGANTRRKLDPQEFRGFVIVNDYAPLVFVNGADGKAAQMFTLAHELAHLFLGQSAIFDLVHLDPADDPVERLCNQVAAEFLVPAQQLRQEWPRGGDVRQATGEIARAFKVSSLVAARKAVDEGLINRDAFLTFYAAYQEDEHRRLPEGQRRGNFWRSMELRLSPTFARTVIQAVRQGDLLYSEAYRLTGLYGKTFDRLMQRLLSEEG
ncbi:MAG: ImmA/IrrE family metallo-endopeptidase [Firmicutes bacterium]|nr:ImmA/IrrE family metallo-endopeptidase [Bacillota bacterium]